jgi:hypothetical protein
MIPETTRILATDWDKNDEIAVKTFLSSARGALIFQYVLDSGEIDADNQFHFEFPISASKAETDYDPKISPDEVQFYKWHKLTSPEMWWLGTGISISSHGTRKIDFRIDRGGWWYEFSVDFMKYIDGEGVFQIEAFETEIRRTPLLKLNDRTGFKKAQLVREAQS